MGDDQTGLGPRIEKVALKEIGPAMGDRSTGRKDLGRGVGSLRLALRHRLALAHGHRLLERKESRKNKRTGPDRLFQLLVPALDGTQVRRQRVTGGGVGRGGILRPSEGKSG